MQLALRVIAVISFIVAIIWMIVAPGFEPLLAFLAGISTLLASLVVNKSKDFTETFDQRNRRVMLNHVETFWIKGVLEKSLHGAALLELGIREDPRAVNYPWTIKREATKETLPAGKSMLEIYEEVGMGRSLLILGAPGSGKTTMLLELARQLVECAQQDETEPIPVVFNLASWKENQKLAEWLAEQLNAVYYVPKKIAPSWVDENRMFLLLDGLDEVKEGSRVKCVEAINQFKKEHGFTSLVVCSRLDEYGIISTKLSLEGAVTLEPLSSQQINIYIDRFENQLDRLRLLLRRDPILEEMAKSPLILSIMAVAYSDADAYELVAFRHIKKQRTQLFDTYIARMFAHSTRTRKSLSRQQILRPLSWLARKMLQHRITSYQIETMQPYWLEKETQRWLYRLYLGLITGLFFWLIGGLIMLPTLGLAFGIMFKLPFVIFIMFIAAIVVAMTNRVIVVDKLKWSWSKSRNRLLGALIFVLVFMLLITWLLWRSGATPDEWVIVLSGFVYMGLFSALIIGIFSGLSSEQIEETAYPGQRLKRTFLNGLLAMLIVGVIVALLSRLLLVLLGGFSTLPTGEFGFMLTYGLLAGLPAGLLGGYIPFLQHYSLRLVLAQSESLPWSLVPFLDYAVDLIFLRRVGGSYIFIHRLLMEHFAEMEV